jgi:hypothetical protein
MKVLYFDRSGFCIWSKRLEAGCFLSDWGQVRTHLLQTRPLRYNFRMDPAPTKKLPSEAEMASYSTAQFIALVHTLATTVQSLQHQLEWFQRQMFGTKSERLRVLENAQQLAIYTLSSRSLYAATVIAYNPVESAMTSEEIILLEKRRAAFNQFYHELMPALVDFVGKMGINPAHEVLKKAEQYVPYLDRALQTMVVANERDRSWLLARMGYFIGEYFVQKYGDCWYVNEIQGSRYFARYVVGKFSRLNNPIPMLDPLSIAQGYVDARTPRHLQKLLTDAEDELTRYARTPNT